MFDAKTYAARRDLLRKNVKDGLILLPGNGESAMNYPANPYPFRQDSTFLYFFGIDKPDFAGVIDVDENKDYIFGTDFTIDDIIWMGPQPSVKELAAAVGVQHTGAPAEMKEMIDKAAAAGRTIHFLPPYRAETQVQLAGLLNISNEQAKQDFSDRKSVV